MSRTSDKPGTAHLGALTLGALGVVYGDIGTSPLYVMQTVFESTSGLTLTPANLIGIVSLIFWSLMVVVTLKYVTLIMRADNHGEGGIMALLSLAASSVTDQPRLRKWLLVIGVFGAALFYGDGVITPAISVLSAVEGLKLAIPSLSPYVVEIAVAVLIALFLLQKRGTAGIGAVFGPIMVVWFGILAAIGIYYVVQTPAILQALNPLEGIEFGLRHRWIAFVGLGSVVLALTGAEALYADMGHFGVGPVRLSWFACVLPALTLNYFGQGALLLAHPGAIENPFFRMFPNWALVPMVILATMATVIASQAVISGAFSMTKQAIQLGFLPRMRIMHTSVKEVGQIFVPSVNTALLVAVLGAVLGFRSSTALGAAYGIAVTGTMLITTMLTFFVLRHAWKYRLLPALAATGFFFAIDVMFFSANLLKVVQGGWFPLVIGTLIFIGMVTWAKGRELLSNSLRADAIELKPFLRSVLSEPPMRAPGTAVFMNAVPDLTPTALLHNLKHNNVLHRQNLFVTVHTHDVPWVPSASRGTARQLCEGCWEVTLNFGFKNDVDVPASLERLQGAGGFEIDPMMTSYFLSRATIVPTLGGGMMPWREKLYASMHRNAASAADFLNLPPNRVVELGTKVQI
ncbi:MAG: potassium transporter Kup [Pseudomonadota bacterium]|nr:potassium transporter Kup [Pseudomonadota bacterium]